MLCAVYMYMWVYMVPSNMCSLNGLFTQCVMHVYMFGVLVDWSLVISPFSLCIKKFPAHWLVLCAQSGSEVKSVAGGQ